MEFNIHDPVPKKMTDKSLNEGDRKKRKRTKRSSKNTGVKKSSEDSKSQSGYTEEDADGRESNGIPDSTAGDDSNKHKNIVIRKAEVEQVQKAQKNIQFWFD